MTGSPVRVSSAVLIPELGSSLGRIALPSGPPHTPVPLDAIRLDLATAIFELAADARSWSSAGDRQAAVDALGRAAWLAAWEAAARAAAETMATAIDARLLAAAHESLIPRRTLRKVLLTDAEKRAVAARLGRAGFALAEGLVDLDREGHRMREAGVLDRAAGDRWRESLTTAARSLEAAWLDLEQAALEEWDRWSPLENSVRSWRRSRWVLWAVSAAVIALLVYAGLVIGGYLPGPPFLDRVADWWWQWWDRLVEPA